MVPRRNSQVMLSTKQHFWRTLFEENDLARQIPELAINGVNGSETIRLEISHYGEVVVKAKAASTLGDNFMSDTFIVEATQAQTDTKFSGFIKVGYLNYRPALINLFSLACIHRDHIFVTK